jgi:rod shape determining protein RodA
MDWLMLLPMFLLLIFGLIAIHSLSYNYTGSDFNNFQRQAIFTIISLFFFFLVALIDYRVWKNYANIFYVLSLFLLLLIFIVGKATNGAVSWFRLGFFNFQPVEFVKISLILLLAKYFSQIETKTLTWKNIIISFIYAFIPIFLVVLQPDMGSAMVLLSIWAGLLFLAGLKLRQATVLIFAGLLAVGLTWTMVLHSYQKQRIISFLNPARDALGSGYNVIQAMVAIGSGGLGGKGIGNGSQSQLNFIPEKHTDFIFATIAEESGLIGVFLIILFFLIIFFRMKVVTETARDRFGKLLVSGVLIMIFFQVVVNMGMNLGVLPVAGLSLPFLSYGGSFLITIMVLMGMIQNVWLKNHN